MNLTVEQVVALAPDIASVVAGKKLALPTLWKSLGRNAQAIWGECQGSALYQVQVDCADFAVRCSCPSHKVPCKHGLGLLFLAAHDSSALSEAVSPAWLTAWLAKRATTATKRETTGQGASPVSGAANRRKQADRRLALVRQGVDGLDLWLNDLIRQGIAGLELRPASFWEAAAARLVDAQAPGLAARVRRLAAIPNASPDWPERLLASLGRLSLLCQAFRRIASLDPALAEDVRQAVGWSLSQDEVVARGEAVTDEWAVLGQRLSQEDRLRVQRLWLRGLRTERDAVILQFAAPGQPFQQVLAPGTRLEADLVFWPSAFPQRAMLHTRHTTPEPLCRLPHGTRCGDCIAQAAQALARQPWLESMPCVLGDAVPVIDADGGWWMRNGDSHALPLVKGEHWRLMALSGGRSLELTGEWDGRQLRPLAVVADGVYHALDGLP